MKQFIQNLIVALITLCATLPAVAADGDDFTYDGINYTVISEADKTCKTKDGGSSAGPKVTGNIVIPETVLNGNESYTVVGLGDKAFSNCFELTSIELPNTITTIGERAFFWCDGLTKIVIPNSVISIGKEAFYWCRGLSKIVIPNSVTSIGQYAFYLCSGLTEVVISNSVTKIEDHTFYCCEGLSKIVIPNSVTSIGCSAFEDCISLKEVVIPSSVTSIEYSAFKECSSLKEVIIPTSVTYLSTYAFDRCNLIKLAYPNTITSSFDSGNYISYPTDATIKDGVIYSHDETAVYFASVKIEGSYTVPSSVTSIKRYAFYGCSGLTEAVLNNSLVSIGNNAFEGCTGITELNFPNSLTSIGDFAFDGCSGLKKIKFGNSLRSLGQYTFDHCTGLTSVVLPPSLTTTGSYPFDNCTSLIKSAYPSTITNPFKSGVCIPYPVGCIVDDDEFVYDEERANVYFAPITLTGEYSIPASVTSVQSYAFANCSGITDITIPDGVTSIVDNAFRDCSALGTLTIPETVTSIGKQAFKGCPITELNFNAINCQTCGDKGAGAFDNTIKFLNFGKDVSYIPPYMMCGGSQIQNLTIPNRVLTIGKYAFDGNSMLKSITIGAGVTTIDDHAFPTSTPKIFWLGNTPPAGYTAASVDYGLCNYTSNDKYSFSLGNEPVIYPFLSSKFEVDGVIYVPVSPSERTCDVIDCNYYATGDEIVIPKVVTNQGISLSVYNISDYAFYDNPVFSKLTLSELTNEIRTSAFFNCNKIESLTFPCGVTKIADLAFKQCSSVTEITFEDEQAKTDPVILGSNGKQGLFLDCPITKLYIGRKLEYKPGELTGYSPFAHIKTLLDVEIADYEIKVDDYEFYMCTALKKLKIGNGVKTIGRWAFSGDYSLEYYSAGRAVESIGEEAFSDCTGVTDFYSYSVNPPVCGEQSLDDINKWNCTLYVPAQSSDEYMVANQWKDFFHIEEMEAPEVAEIRLDKTEASIKVGETLQLTATVLPEEAAGAVLTWSSSDESIATVSATGLVKAVSIGTATISVTCGNVTATCTVEVSDDAGIDGVLVDGNDNVEVYNLQGVRLNVSTREELSKLTTGFYIVNGKKLFVK